MFLCTGIYIYVQAPELLLSYDRYSYSVDMWSFGCLLAGLLFKKDVFFKGACHMDQINKIVRVLGTDCLERYIDKYDLRHPCLSPNQLYLYPVSSTGISFDSRKYKKKSWLRFVNKGEIVLKNIIYIYPFLPLILYIYPFLPLILC